MTERCALRGTAEPATLDALDALRRRQAQVLMVHPDATTTETEQLLQHCGEPPFWPETMSASGAGGVLIGTSGTSGEPKVVCLTWSALEHSAHQVWQALGGRAGDHWLCPLPLAHVAGLAAVERCRVGGGVPLFVQAGGRGEELLRALQGPEVQFASLVPTQLSRLLNVLKGRRAPALKALLVGGAAMPPELLQQAREQGFPIVCSYGLSEAGSTVAMTALQDARRPEALGDWAELLPSFEAQVVDGELQLRGPALFQGYFGAPARQPGDWFPTGDRAELRDRTLRITGRQGLSFKRGGEWIDPLEIEQTLASCVGVDEVAILAEPDPDLGRRIVAVVVPEAGAEDLLAHLEQFCREHLARHKHPSRWEIRSQKLPRSPLGKIRRRQLMG